MVINLASGGTGGVKSNGLSQYYTNPAALEKLLKTVTHARSFELGKLAAAEYEAKIKDDDDYLTSVKRSYQRTSVLSTLTPLSLFLKINPEASHNPESLASFVEAALRHNIEGLVLESSSHESQVQQLKKIREIDSQHNLVVVAGGHAGQGVGSGKDALSYLQAGANACSLYSAMFTKGPYACRHIE